MVVFPLTLHNVLSQVTHQRFRMNIEENETVKSYFSCLLGFWVVLELCPGDFNREETRMNC